MNEDEIRMSLVIIKVSIKLEKNLKILDSNPALPCPPLNQVPKILPVFWIPPWMVTPHFARQPEHWGMPKLCSHWPLSCATARDEKGELVTRTQRAVPAGTEHPDFCIWPRPCPTAPLLLSEWPTEVPRESLISVTLRPTVVAIVTLKTRLFWKLKINDTILHFKQLRVRSWSQNSTNLV